MDTRRQAHQFALVVGGLAVICGACGGAGARTGGRVPDPADSVSATSGGKLAADDETGAVAVIREEELSRMHGGSIEEMIAGRVPGLQLIRTAGGYSFRLRGTSSFMGSDEPLFVIDGMPVRSGGISGALAMLAPHDIARIEVLKDAGAAGLYGMRGANGVIIITTKRDEG